MIYNMDPKMKLVPDYVLNHVMKLIALVFLNKVASKAEKLDDTYKNLIIEKKGFYD